MYIHTSIYIYTHTHKSFKETHKAESFLKHTIITQMQKIRYFMRGTSENSFCYSVDSLASRRDISMTKEKDNSVQISSSH